MKWAAGRNVLFSKNAVTLAVIGGCALLLLAVILPAILRARDSARRVQSRNNLKQLALGLHNYHDVYTQFPIGADIDPAGIAKHGWIVRLIPYLEASDLYMRIEMTEAWDHGVNGHLFQMGHGGLINPRLPEQYTEDGFGLTNYEANPNVMHRNNSISLTQIPNGSANQWLVGEVATELKPWAYPFNWRPLTWPLNSARTGYGDGHDGVQFAMADGAVLSLSAAIDESVIASLANAPPIAPPEVISQPERKFGLNPDPVKRLVYSFPEYDQRLHKGAASTTIQLDRAGHAHTADVQLTGDGQQLFDQDGASIRIDLPGIAKIYPTLRVLILRNGVLDDSTIAYVLSFRDLETLAVSQILLSDASLAQLKSLQHLTWFSGEATIEMQEMLRRDLPNCRLRMSTPSPF